MTIRKAFIYVSIMAVSGVFCLHFVSVAEEGSKVRELEIELKAIRDMLPVDSVRALRAQKVAEIIAQYNPEMPTEMRVDITHEIYAMTVKYPNLNVDLLCATITHESARTWNPRIVSEAGALGLMQIMPRTGRWLAGQEKIRWTQANEVLFDPVHSIRLGSRYLSRLIRAYGLQGGLAAYNGGMAQAERWLQNHRDHSLLHAETRDYIPQVLELYDEFDALGE